MDGWCVASRETMLTYTLEKSLKVLCSPAVKCLTCKIPHFLYKQFDQEALKYYLVMNSISISHCFV